MCESSSDGQGPYFELSISLTLHLSIWPKLRHQNPSFLKALGPGLLFAGTSVGVSRTCAVHAGWRALQLALLIVVLGACVVGEISRLCFWPVVRPGHGHEPLEGYRRQGKWALWLFLFVTLGTVFTVQAVVTAVAASILTSVLGLNWASPVEFLNLGPVVVVSALLLAACALLLRAGEYKWLDLVNKVLIFVLTVSTLVATVLALTRLDLSRATFAPPEAMFTSGAAILADRSRRLDAQRLRRFDLALALVPCAQAANG